jgi:Na+-transporting methylmalonyl-CoA/oxaloacetate decarboxylase gamma subunit
VRGLIDEKGVALVIALIMLLILTFIGISAISTTTFETNISGNERVGTDAFYASEAILQVGLKRVPENYLQPIARMRIGEDSYGWSVSPTEKRIPQPLQYLGPCPPPIERGRGGFELGDSPTGYHHRTPGNFLQFQINATGESLGATREIEAQVRFGPF